MHTKQEAGNGRWIRKALVLFALLAVATIGLGGFLLYPVIRQPLVAPVSRPRDDAAGRVEDALFLKRFAEVNRSFSSAALARFGAEVDAIVRDAPHLSAAAFEMRAARAVAVADDGHTNVRGASYGLTLNAIPLRLYQFADGIHVIAAAPAYRALVGARLTSIDEHLVSDVIAGLHPYIGGAEAYRREHMLYLMISPAALHAARLARNDDRLVLGLEDVDGRASQVAIAAAPSPTNGQPTEDAAERERMQDRWPRRWLSPVAFPGNDRPWRFVFDASGPLPLALARPNTLYWSQPISDAKLLYVQLNAVGDAPRGPDLETFLSGILRELRERKYRGLVIDLRGNSGGNSDLIADFTRELPAALPKAGRVALLTSGNTFSAAIIMIARVRHFVGRDAMIIGTPMGDRGKFWAEGQDFVLPNSRLLVKATAAYHDWENGCGLRNLRRCFLMNYVFGVAAGPLEPDVLVQPSFAEFASGRDPTLERAVEVLNNHPKSSTPQ